MSRDNDWQPQPWGQRDEITFLENMGTYTDKAPKDVRDVSSARRVELLAGYLEALCKPRRWFPGAAPQELRARALELLEAERRRGYPSEWRDDGCP